MKSLTVVYQGGRALRAIRDCVVMPTHFTSITNQTKQVHRPGFALIGTVFGRERAFYVVEDQLFLLSSVGRQYHVGTVQAQTLEILSAVREQIVKYFKMEK